MELGDRFEITGCQCGLGYPERLRKLHHAVRISAMSMNSKGVFNFVEANEIHFVVGDRRIIRLRDSQKAYGEEAVVSTLDGGTIARPSNSFWTR